MNWNIVKTIFIDGQLLGIIIGHSVSFVVFLSWSIMHFSSPHLQCGKGIFHTSVKQFDNIVVAYSTWLLHIWSG